MEPITAFLDSFRAERLVFLLISAAAGVLCITVHELCHGLAALALGDGTARRAGRLTLNPLAHLDPIGFVLLVVAHVGWAKPVPVDIRNFRVPKRDMALTALAGPASNFALALLSLGVGSVLVRNVAGAAATYALVFVCYTAVLSVGLGLFNLIPIPPLDGSKVLCAFLPDRLYYAYLRYERYLMLLVIALAWLGVFGGVLSAGMGRALELLCRITAFPYELLRVMFGF